VLEAAGLVRVVRTRRVRALTEKVYGRTARLFVLKSADEAPHVRVRLPAEAAERFRTRLEELAREVEAAASADGEEYELVASLHPRGGKR
jgi:predicted ArsR family transcriptional regulator